ncbi:hypothetical protein DPMN_047186 [Dreissena polymorpha]|uniref:Uncharacterized protein n=1 Tax=Dreissena polymorpha TaxID=45954 RepID=A0A9D4D921_DREPO|nr:hypothetical protein DPMN_047186 [Dreissena polymorpha]
MKADLVLEDRPHEVIAAAGPVLRQTLVQYLGVQIHCVVQVYGVLVGLKSRMGDVNSCFHIDCQTNQMGRAM